MQMITYNEAREIEKVSNDFIYLDVRSPLEYEEGHLPGAVLLPLYEMDCNIEKVIPCKKDTILVYCSTGGRSKEAIKKLIKLGYKNLYELEGGLDSVCYI